MGLIDFLEGAYQGGRLLLLLYDHDKRVKLRYRAIKDSGIKRLPNLSGVIVSESVKYAQKQALVNQQSRYVTRDILEDEIKSSLAQGFEVTVHNDHISVRCPITDFSEWVHITDNISKETKIRMINQMKYNINIRRGSVKRPLPSNRISPHYDDIIGGTFGFVGSLATSACVSLIKGYNAKRESEQRRMELISEGWESLSQNLNRYEKK